jgi:hypothetical protein
MRRREVMLRYNSDGNGWRGKNQLTTGENLFLPRNENQPERKEQNHD